MQGLRATISFLFSGLYFYRRRCDAEFSQSGTGLRIFLDGGSGQPFFGLFQVKRRADAFLVEGAGPVLSDCIAGFARALV